MIRTRTALWLGLAWLTAVQALFQISHEPTDYRIPKEPAEIDANMTIEAISMDWIEVCYDLGENQIIEFSYIDYMEGSQNERTSCPPQVYHHSERMGYCCRIPDLSPCTAYNLRYYGIPITEPVTEIYTSEINDVLTTGDETIPPGNLICSASAPGTLMVTWIDPFPEDCQAAFVVSWEGQALWDEGLSATSNANTSDSSYTLTEVIPEAEYTLNVSVWFQGDYPGATASIQCVTLTEESSAPQNVSVTPSSYKVTANWEDPAQLNGILSHYDVIAKWDNGSVAVNLSTDGLTNEAVLLGLAPCSSYQVTVAAVNGAGPGSKSDPEEATTLADDTIPPANLTCTASAPGTLTVEWYDPFPEDCQAAFVVSWEGKALWGEGLSATSNATTSNSSYTLTEVIPEADYILDVAVWFQGNIPGATTSCHCTTLAEESSAPQNVSVTPSFYDVTANWETPALLNGVIIHYDVIAKWDNDSVAVNLSTDGPTNEAVLSGLAPCSSYLVTVAAVNGAGPGAQSDPEEATTPADDDVNPNIRLTCYNETQGVSVEWTDVLTNCGPSTYSLSYSVDVAWDESKNIPLTNAALHGGLSFQVPERDYVPGAHYRFQLSTATRNGSCDVKSNDETSSPPVITGADTGIRFIYLTWEPPTAANGVIDSYELNLTVEEESASTKTIIIDAVNEYNLTEDVFACSAYHMTLAPHNGAGLGETDTKDAATLWADLSGIECDVESDHSVVVAWTAAPANCDRNGTILSWQGESKWDQYNITDSTLLGDQVAENLLTDLYPYTDYNICVTLTEEWAEEACCDATTNQGKNVQASSTLSSISLTWEQPESWNGIPSKYVVVCPSVDLTEEMDVNITELTISELQEGTHYSIAVQACNEEQCSDSFMKDVSTAERRKEHPDTGLIVGLTLGFAAVIALVVAFFVVRKKRRNQLNDQTESERVVAEIIEGSNCSSLSRNFSKTRAFRSTSSSSSSSASSGITVSKL